MRVSAEPGARPGVAEAAAVMATESNLALLRESGRLEGRCAAGPNGVLVVVRGETELLLAKRLRGVAAGLHVMCFTFMEMASSS